MTFREEVSNYHSLSLCHMTVLIIRLPYLECAGGAKRLLRACDQPCEKRAHCYQFALHGPCIIRWLSTIQYPCIIHNPSKGSVNNHNIQCKLPQYNSPWWKMCPRHAVSSLTCFKLTGSMLIESGKQPRAHLHYCLYVERMQACYYRLSIIHYRPSDIYVLYLKIKPPQLFLTG